MHSLNRPEPDTASEGRPAGGLDLRGLHLPQREGRPPLVSTRGRVEQITQSAPADLQRVLLQMAAALPGVRIGPSLVCLPGTRACHLSHSLAAGPAQAFFAGTEFGHLHPVYDGSLHLMLPAPVAEQVIATGWGAASEPEGSVLVFAPRDEAEVEIVWQLLLTAYRHAASAQTRRPGHDGPDRP
ncbi:luciferase domain-containing protein [Streptacidiphilus rugosus]|uniref:luciferase domain-containing protein n=1 Tax=Streptacidiphilus rugosus TaxID=405783 RepID=UPI000691D737|nr:luciferase family protein [Streptacidiphilus rugosus]